MIRRSLRQSSDLLSLPFLQASSIIDSPERSGSVPMCTKPAVRAFERELRVGACRVRGAEPRFCCGVEVARCERCTDGRKDLEQPSDESLTLGAPGFSLGGSGVSNMIMSSFEIGLVHSSPFQPVPQARQSKLPNQ